MLEASRSGFSGRALGGPAGPVPGGASKGIAASLLVRGGASKVSPALMLKALGCFSWDFGLTAMVMRALVNSLVKVLFRAIGRTCLSSSFTFMTQHVLSMQGL